MINDIAKPVDRLTVPIDWDALFLEFVKQEETTSATGWLKLKGWSEGKVYSGNTSLHIKEWGTKRAELRRKIIDKQLENAKASFSEILPLLVKEKRNIFMSYIEELQNPKLSLRDRSHILTRIKTELGEPAIITKQNTEDVGEHQDPAMALLVMMGVIKPDGTINLAVAGTQSAAPQSDGTAPNQPA